MNTRPVTHDTDTDVLRLLAAFAVVVIHVADHFSKFSLLYNSLAHFSVPVFILISGYYILPDDGDIRSLLRRAAGLFVRMISWGAIYFVVDSLVIRSEDLPLGFFRYILTRPTVFWYQWMIIAMLIFTPLLHILNKKADKREYQYILVLFFALGSFLTLALRAGISSTLAVIVEQMKIPYTLALMGCYMLGGYFRRFGMPKKRWPFAIAWAVGLAVTFLWAINLSGDMISALALSFFAPNTILMGVSVFVLIKDRGINFSYRAGKILKVLGAQTDGVYYLHALFIALINEPLIAAFSALPLWASLVLRTVIIFLAAFGTTFVLHQVPVFNWLLGDKHFVPKYLKK